jgi:uncharacterized membrane protein YjjP (DUF1212 family)
MRAPSQPEMEPTDVLHLISASVALLFENGQTTERTISAATKLGAALGYSAIVLPRWGEVNIRIDGLADRPQEVIAATPAGVDMNKVIATVKVIDDVCDSRIDAAAARSSLEAITRFPAVGVTRFALFAAAGASALAVIFGATHWSSLTLIAFSAGIGACLRRWLSGMSRDLVVQPLSAALLAALMAQGEKASPDLLLGTVTDGVTASLILLAMAFGLIAPKMLIEHFYPNIGEVRKPTS